MQKQSIEIVLPANLEFSPFVRETSKVFFLEIGFSCEWAERLKLVLDELFTNAYKYGSKKGESKIYIQLSYDESNTYFHVEDEGHGEKKVSVEELRDAIEHHARELNDLGKKSGRGLALISTLWTDELTVENGRHGGLLIGFRKAISKQVPPIPLSSDLVSDSMDRLNRLVHLAPGSVLPDGPQVHLKLSGEIHSGNIEEKIAPILEALEALPRHAILVFDCSELKYFNSTFIGYLASWHNDLQEKDAHLVLKNTNDEIRSVLHLVGLTQVIYLEA